MQFSCVGCSKIFNRKIGSANLCDKCRFEEKYIKNENGCWIWKNPTRLGYGRFRFNKKEIMAHRISYIFNKGNIPKGLKVLHSCDEKSCVNPDHLWLGTQKENVQDMLTKGRNNHPTGERCHFSRLSEKDILKIRKMRKTFKTSLSKIAKYFQTTKTTISNIINKKTWKHI